MIINVNDDWTKRDPDSWLVDVQTGREAMKNSGLFIDMKKIRDMNTTVDRFSASKNP